MDGRNAEAFFKSLDQKDALFLASAAHLEMSRASISGEFTPMFQYLSYAGKPEGATAGAFPFLFPWGWWGLRGHPAYMCCVAEDVETETALIKVLGYIADAVLRQFLARCDSVGRNESSQAVLLNRCRFLLSLSGNRRPVVRTTALRFLVSILDRFPSLQCDFGPLFALLDVVEILTVKASQLNSPQVAPGSSESAPVKLPSCPTFYVDAPASVTTITAIVAGAVLVTRVWSRLVSSCVSVRLLDAQI